MQRSNDVNKHEFGKPSQTTRKHSKFDVVGDDLTVIPVEIEIDYCLYNMTEKEILENIRPANKVSFEEWVNICFRENGSDINRPQGIWQTDTRSTTSSKLLT